MNCESLRSLIGADSDEISGEMETHLDACLDCQIWLDASIAGAPQGFGPPIWEKPPILAEQVNPKSGNTFLGFLDGLKYGLAFGFAVVLALALLPQRQPSAPMVSSIVIHHYSFLPSRNSLEEVNFVTEIPETQSLIGVFSKKEVTCRTSVFWRKKKRRNHG